MLNVCNIADDLLSEASSVNEKDTVSRSVVKKVGFDVPQKLPFAPSTGSDLPTLLSKPDGSLPPRIPEILRAVAIVVRQLC